MKAPPVGAAAERGVLLINLGSPDAPSVPAVRRYLAEFLMDPYVIDSPALVRRLVVSGFILPFRPKRTAAAYAAIWTDEGSPLLCNSRRFADRLRDALGQPVALAMRYGEPSIASGLAELLTSGVRRIFAVPLYPQHADSTRTTALVEVRQQLARLDASVGLEVMPPFYAEPSYIDALVTVCRSHLPAGVDALLFSYHGLPERQIVKADPTGQHCLRSADCCERPSLAHASCYRHQSRVTSARVARALDLPDSAWTLSYQSRLGRLPWLSPYTDEFLASAPSRGIRRLAVVCPAFVADNLETLEEIGLRGRETFLAAGGEQLTLVPCLNDHPDFVAAVAAWCRNPPPPSPADAFA